MLCVRTTSLQSLLPTDQMTPYVSNRKFCKISNFSNICQFLSLLSYKLIELSFGMIQLVYDLLSVLCFVLDMFYCTFLIKKVLLISIPTFSQLCSACCVERNTNRCNFSFRCSLCRALLKSTNQLSFYTRFLATSNIISELVICTHFPTATFIFSSNSGLRNRMNSYRFI